MTAVFADTFYYAALVNLQDAAHKKATAYARAAVGETVTTAWVVTELADGLCQVDNRRTFIRLLSLLQDDPLTSIVPPDQALMERGIALYSARPDKDWSLTDCISFVVMREAGIQQALTGDQHFEQAGFVALLK